MTAAKEEESALQEREWQWCLVGNIVGEHEVIFAGTDEVITLKHTAYSKAVFAKGTVEAAKFLAGKKAGIYDMQDVIQAK